MKAIAREVIQHWECAGRALRNTLVRDQDASGDLSSIAQAAPQEDGEKER